MNYNQTVIIPKRIFPSILISFGLTIFVIYLFHLFGDWRGIAKDVDWSSPENSGMLTIPAQENGFWNSCGLRGESHHITFDEPTYNWKDHDSIFDEIKLSSSLTNTFDNHWGIIFIFTFIGTFIVYQIGKLKFKIAD